MPGRRGYDRRRGSSSDGPEDWEYNWKRHFPDWDFYTVNEIDVPAEQVGEQSGPLHDLGQLLAEDPQHQLDRFSFGGATDLLPPLPGLRIEGYGRLTLPLDNATDAQRLAAVCQLAPFGRGQDTLIDPTVRKTWQIEPGKIAFGNPAWNEGIAAFAPLIAEKLGFPGTPLALHLYKLLFYEAGGHFGKHRDTEKEDGMFATLVVQLPSMHSGGQLLVYRGGTPITHDFGDAGGTAPFKCHYAVHYADAEHEITPVTEGYRLALVYSICWPAEPKDAAVPTSAGADAVNQMMTLLTRLLGEERQFHLFLEHDYTHKSISELGARALKGVDRERIARLQVANGCLSGDRVYDFYFAEAKRRTVYSFYQDAWDEYESPEVTFAQLHKLDGTSLAGSRDLASYFGHRDVLNPLGKSLLSLWRGHRKERLGDLGNEGPSQVTTYKKYVVVAWPRRLNQALEGIRVGQLEALRTLLTQEPSDDELAEFLQSVREARSRQAFPLRTTLEDQLRHTIFIALLERPFSPRLFGLYLDLHRTARLLIHNHEGWQDLLRLMRWPRAWKAGRARVVEAFAQDPCTTLKLIDKYPKEDPVEMKQLLIEALLRSESGDDDELWRNLQQAISWRVALSLPEPAVCRNLVQRYLNVRDDQFDVHQCMGSLLSAQRLHQNLFAARRHIFQPLLQRCIAKLEDKRASASGSKADYWRFQEAEFPADARVEDFLQSYERTETVKGFDCIQSARKLVETCQKVLSSADALDAEKWQRCSHTLPKFSFTAVEGGRGRGAYVTLTKTDAYPQHREAQRLVRVAGLERDIKTLGSLLVVDAGAGPSGSGSGSISAGVELEQTHEAEAAPPRSETVGEAAEGVPTSPAFEPLHRPDIETDAGPSVASGAVTTAAATGESEAMVAAPSTDDQAQDGAEHQDKKVKLESKMG